MIGTHIAGLQDLIRPGETGWLAPAESPAELARAIEELLSDRAASARFAPRHESWPQRLVGRRSPLDTWNCTNSSSTRRCHAQSCSGPIHTPCATLDWSRFEGGSLN